MSWYTFFFNTVKIRLIYFSSIVFLFRHILSFSFFIWISSPRSCLLRRHQLHFSQLLHLLEKLQFQTLVLITLQFLQGQQLLLLVLLSQQTAVIHLTLQLLHKAQEVAHMYQHSKLFQLRVLTLLVLHTTLNNQLIPSCYGMIQSNSYYF